MFEDLLGSHKYRSQRKATLLKFEITKTDLERVQDIIAEVEQKVHHLELQLKRFKRHATLTETLEIKDKELAYIQIHRFQSLIHPLRKKIEEYHHLRESKSSQSSVHEQEMKSLRDAYKSQESELNELQVIMDEMNESRESMRNRILVCQEQGRGALLTIERLEREKSSNFGKIEHLKQLKLDFDKEITDLEPAIDEKLQIYKLKKEKFDDIEKKYQETINYLDKTQNDRWELQRKITDDRSIYDRTVALVEDRSFKIKELQGINQRAER
jgi:Chromosome segregation ATPases